VISKRVLEMLVYLCKNSADMAAGLLTQQVSEDASAAAAARAAKGKTPAAPSAAAAPGGPGKDDLTVLPGNIRALELLLGMLSAPLFQRSSSQLEQLLSLIEVVLSTVATQEAQERALIAQVAQAAAAQVAQQQKKKQEKQQQAAAEPGAAAAQPSSGGDAAAATPAPAGAAAAATPTGEGGSSSAPDAAATAAAAGDSTAQDAGSAGSQPAAAKLEAAKKLLQPPPSKLARVLLSTPSHLLRQLPALLSRENMSEAAHTTVLRLLKIIIEVAPKHLGMLLSELVDGTAAAASSLQQQLEAASHTVGSNEFQLAPSVGQKCAVVLRMLHALEGCRKEVAAKLKTQREELDKQQQKQQDKEKDKEGGAAAAAGAEGATTEAAAGAAAGGVGASSSSAEAPASLASSIAALQAAETEIDHAIAAVAAQTSPLWSSLSSCISRLEDAMRAALGAGKAHDAGQGAASGRLLPAGAQQLMPLVEAFFVLCALQGAIPPPPQAAQDLLSASGRAGSVDPAVLAGLTSAGSLQLPTVGSTGSLPGAGSSRGLARAGSMAAAAAGAGSSGAGGTTSHDGGAGPTTSSSGGPAAQEAVLPFLRFAEKHRLLLNAYLRRNSGLLETSLAPLVRVPKLIDFDNKRQYFRWAGLVAGPGWGPTQGGHAWWPGVAPLPHVLLVCHPSTACTGTTAVSAPVSCHSACTCGQQLAPALGFFLPMAVLSGLSPPCHNIE
jgi:E3 ubiquitin-protein ligase HUWE1